jgi:hypothetical protein
MKIARLLLALLCVAAPWAEAATRLLVTVIDPKSGAAVRGLQAGDFTVLDGKTPRPVEAAEFTSDTLDIMLLVDASLTGPLVLPFAQNLVDQLQPKEQMAVVAYDSSANLIQDFTSSRQLIVRALSNVKFGNEPRALDALYAAMSGGFQTSPFRRVALLLTSGMEGYSRTGERDVIALARRYQVSIYPAYVTGSGRAFEDLARETGGASFNLAAMKKAGKDEPGAKVFEAMRSHYVLTLDGNLRLGDKLRVEVKRSPKPQVSALALE